MKVRSLAAAFALVAALPLATCGDGATPSAPTSRTPSVRVTTVAPRQGSLPTLLTAYGSAAPSQTGSVTLSYPQPGTIAALLVTSGAHVSAGQPLLRFVTAPAARSSYQQAVDALAAARKQQASTAQLLSQHLATQDQLAQADKAVADARSALAALEADGAGQAVRTLSAPFAGVVTSIAVSAGDRPQAGAPLLTLARSGAMVVTAGLQPAQQDAVKVGDTATLQRLSGGPALSGQVVRVDAMLNPVTRMVDVDLAFPGGALLPGEAMEARIETGRTEGWVVPHKAVVTANGTAQVFQVVAGKAKGVPVKILLTADDQDVVSGPLDARHALIVEGAYQVTEGVSVRRSPSAQPRDSQAKASR